MRPIISPGSVKVKPIKTDFPRSRKPKRVNHPTGALKKAKQHSEENNMSTKMVKYIRKALSTVSSIIGVGVGGSLFAGGLTGDVIIDGIIVLGAVTVLLLNGKEGVPDWLIKLVKERMLKRPNEKGKKK